MKRVVIDIETVGVPRESLTEGDEWELARWGEKRDDPETVYDELALNAMTGRVAAIGMLNPDTGKGRVYVQPDTAEVSSSEDGMGQFVAASEEGMLEAFWRDVSRFEQVITYNGRGFDVPFLAYRSAAHRIPATMGLAGKRYSTVPHCDLMDQLSFYGAAWPRRSLHFFCQTFGIESPKGSDAHGGKVDEMWADGRHDAIAEYCWHDVVATAELYRLWAEYVKPAGGK